MKAKIRLIVIIAAAVLVLGGAVLALVLTAPKEEEEAPAAAPQSSLLFDKDFKAVGRLTVTNSFGTYELLRYGDESAGYAWTVPEYADSPVSMTKVSKLLEACASLTAQKTVTENAPDLSIYGLAEPEAVYKTEFDDTALTVKEVCIGDTVPGASSTRYMCMKGENTVYTVKNSEVSCFYSDKRDLIEKTVYNARTAKDENDTTNYTLIKKLSVVRKDLEKEVVFEYDDRLDDGNTMVVNMSSYRMTAPVTLDLNPDRSSDLTSGIFGLTASDFAVLHPQESDFEEYGISDPFAEININIADVDNIKITVGNEYKDEDGKSAGYYAFVEGIDIIYIFDKSSLPWVTFDPMNVITSMVTSNYIFSLTAMNVTAGDLDARFAMTGSSNDDFEVKLDGSGVSTDDFKQLYQYILSAPAEEFCFDEPSGTPELTLEIVTKTHTDVLEYYPLGSRRSLVRLNGVSSFSCKSSYVERLKENIVRFRNGEDIIKTW